MEHKIMKLKKKCAVLVGIDFQEKLMPAMGGSEEVTEAAAKLVKGCRVLGVPMVFTQQYTKGLGATVAPVIEALSEPAASGEASPEVPFIEKLSFSAAGEPAFMEALESAGKKAVILAGVEAHVCVLQTALDLMEKGYAVYLAADAISSRNKTDKKYALRRMQEEGAVITTCEAILFELLQGAKEQGFKQISAIVK